MRIVFDLDDTICRAENRDYVNASEIAAVVSKIREIRETLPDVEIVVHTSRGMASCNGDVTAAEEKNRPTIEEWLKSHDIKVDEIIFGKPLADLYVDDKGMSAAEFAKSKIHRYYGFSGATVTRIGRMMIKEGSDLNRQAEWYKVAADHYRKVSERNFIYGDITVPRIHSLTLGKLYMDFVPGQNGVTQVSSMMLHDLLDILTAEEVLPGENDLEAYAEYVESRAKAIDLSSDIGKRLRNCEALKQRTFCHGDMSLSNIICTKDGYAMIDPSPKEGMESWIIDAAKLRASLKWLDRILAKHPHSNEMAQDFDDYIMAKIQCGIVDRGAFEAIKLVEESHLIRVWYYAHKLGRKTKQNELAKYYRRQYGKR